MYQKQTAQRNRVFACNHMTGIGLLLMMQILTKNPTSEPLNCVVTYKGGNNHRHDRFYADRHVNKPSVHQGNTTPHHGKPAVHNDKKTWRNTNVNNGHKNSNHEIAHNGSGHFGRR